MVRLTIKLGPHDAWYVFVVRHVWMCQKDLSNLTHTVCFDVSIYHQIGEPDVTNEQITHLLKLDTFFHTQDARIMTHDASQIRTTHCVDPAWDRTIQFFCGSGRMSRLLPSTVIESVYFPALVTRGSSLQSWKNGATFTVNCNQEHLFSSACNNDRFLLAGAKEWPTPRYRQW